MTFLKLFPKKAVKAVKKAMSTKQCHQTNLAKISVISLHFDFKKVTLDIHIFTMEKEDLPEATDDSVICLDEEDAEASKDDSHDQVVANSSRDMSDMAWVAVASDEECIPRRRVTTSESSEEEGEEEKKKSNSKSFSKGNKKINYFY